MYKLLSINGVEFPELYESFTLGKNDKVNEYNCEDGSSTIEIVRIGVVDLKLSYKSLTVKKIKELCGAIEAVSDVTVFDPTNNNTRTIRAYISNLNIGKLYHKNNRSAWSLSFDVKEL